MNTPKEQEQLILQQFTKQADTFYKVPAHASADVAALVVKATETQAGHTVLDVACGPGILACAYAKVAKHVTGIDLVPAMIERARHVQQEQKLQNMDWQVGPAAPLPFAAEAFDQVVTRYSFHHFIDHAAVLEEMIRVCRPDGRVAVVDVFVSSDPKQAHAYNHMEKLRDPSHVRALTLHELRTVVIKSGLKNVQENFYKLDMELEAQMQASFPKPGDDAKIRAIIQLDIEKNELGMNVRRAGQEIHFSYPIVILTGVK